MNLEEKMESLRQQQNKRQAKYYQAHKADILSKKQAERAQLKQLNRPPDPPIILPTKYTLEMIQTVFTANISNINTLKKYNGDMKRIFTVASLEFWTSSIDTYNGIKETMDFSRYSLQTKRGAIQSILVFIDKSGVIIDPRITAKYNVLYEVYGIKCGDQNRIKQTASANEVMNYDTYMGLILDNYGADSKQYLIVSLYKECCMRDDYGEIAIINDLNYDEPSHNYIFRHGGVCSIIMNTYKTSTIYGKQTYTLTDHLNKLINNYIDNNDIIQNNHVDFLFPERKKLSVFITKMNEKVGLTGAGINYIRHSRISSFLSKPDLTPEQRHNFAIRTGHKEETQQYYRRGVISNT